MSASFAEALPGAHRKRAYLAYAAIAAITTGIIVGCATAGWVPPEAALFASGFVNAVGVGLGLVAAQNTPTTPADVQAIESAIDLDPTGALTDSEA